ncbi:acyl-CoA carboxylase subunit beta [Actinoplanes sp. DH11]|uniref:acyl-CoA carboxylase subunit beta n=1 Tax=Actinoplanes sp. DH11 TaxID=2857011 RepID=UPI001E3BAD2C|nr:carboxyl transferase domain-containing protein [Actinoplanes sp. DH11]
MTISLTPAPVDEPEIDRRAPVVRLGQLFDPGSYTLLHASDQSGVQAAAGRIGSLEVIAYCTDATRMGGALGAEGADHIIDAIEIAMAKGRPVVGIWHSGGAKLADGVESMDGVGRMFLAMTRASGLIPQVSVVLGPAAGAASYGPALTDVVIMSGAARMFVTGPDIVRSVTGEVIDMESLGGPVAHAKSGVAHLTATTEEEAFETARRITDLLSRPGHNTDRAAGAEDLSALLPAGARRAYDVRPLIRRTLDPAADGAGFDEFQPKWAPNMVIGLGRLAGRAIGVVANNPIRKGGCLDSLSAEKASRFVRMCDSLGVPLLVIVDVPGYLPGVGQEWGGVIRRGAKLLHAFAEAVVPRVTLVTRKSYGGAYIAMNSRSLGATAVFAWPQAEVAVMGAESAVGVLHRRRLAAAHEDDREALKAQLIEQHHRESGGVGRALALGVVDELIDPVDTRRRIAEVIAREPLRRGRHGNVPL